MNDPKQQPRTAEAVSNASSSWPERFQKLWLSISHHPWKTAGIIVGSAVCGKFLCIYTAGLILGGAAWVQMSRQDDKNA